MPSRDIELLDIESAISDELTEAQLYAAYCAASVEGRLHPGIARELNLPTGEHKCPLCGMLNLDKQAATDCCTAMRPRRPRRPSGPRKGRVARIANPDALVMALDMRRIMLDRREREMFPDLGPYAYRNFRNRIRCGDQWVSGKYWRELVRMFGENVPGCERLNQPQEVCNA